MGDLYDYPLPWPAGTRVVATEEVLGSEGPWWPLRLQAPVGAAGTVIGVRWPKGYAVDFDNGARVIVHGTSLTPERPNG